MADRPLILVIEDDLYPTRTRQLERAGFQIEVAETAWEAFYLLKSTQYAGVVLDLMIPIRDNKFKQTLNNKVLDELQQIDFCSAGLPDWVPGVRLLEMILAGEFAVAGNNADLPVVVISGVPNRNVLKKVESLFGDLAGERYLLKPVSPEKLVDSLEKALGIK